MRIVGGNNKGRKFEPPKFFKARPTTDFAKEALFNLISNKIDLEGKSALDLFAGTGSISYEFLSRGCSFIRCVDISNKYLMYIKNTANLISPEKEIIHTTKSDVFKFLPKHELNYDIIFADPPYNLINLEDLADLIYENSTLKEKSIIIIEHSKNTNFSTHPRFVDKRSYGSVNFSFFE
ncbi:MAG: 16S rRNA (guanine(966)-N(2))-methyltransferase RsmD [Bacteroidales bacterium]|nr:16S rRNA (guanine(966)-N(2))-methyltransferase RsmD [Bacteroidales bacterium]MBN2757889.1 16S rRNA (guanine(966)-N(2))-methyltransferase RsmD [Bacteroidales bacterium]